MVKTYENKKLYLKAWILRPLYTYKHTPRPSHMDEHTGKVRHAPFTSIPSGEHKHKRHSTHVLRVLACMQTYVHIHTHAHSPRRFTSPWMIPDPYLPFQHNWAPLSPLLLSALLPFLGSLLPNAFAHSVPSSSHTDPLLSFRLQVQYHFLYGPFPITASHRSVT